MAVNGEERLLTLFADVHYYFSEPGPRPVSHRFDKESYIYLYRDAAQVRGRLEIANHAGSPDQDAFTGYLDSATISQSHRHPALVTIVVDGYRANHPPPLTPNAEHHWRLPSTDPRDKGEYLFRLHTLDLYFWTVEDAHMFLDHARQTLKSDQLDIQGPPMPAPHTNMMSPVVQQLESVAISDPAYHNGQTRNSRDTFALPPPPPAPAVASTTVAPSTAQQASPKQDSTAHTPLAYNPAAPPAPEVHKHREKTPPPPDAASGTGLAAAAYNDHVQSQHPGAYTGVPGQNSHASPPPNQPYGSPSPGQAYTSPPPGQPYGTPAQSQLHSSPPPAQSFGPPPRSSAASSTHDPNAHLYASQNPLPSPTTQVVGNSYVTASQHQPLAHLQPQYPDYLSQHSSPPGGPVAPPPGGYSQYDYNAQPSHHHHHHHQHNPHTTGDTSIHTQVYRPTETEYGGKKPSYTPSEGSGTWGAKAEKAEKGFGRLLRKVEKKIG